MLLDFTPILVVFLAFVRIAIAADCPNNEQFGENNPSSKDDDIDTNVGFAYMMQDNNYAIDCCAVVDNWQVFIKGLTATQTLYFVVWRRTTGSSFELVGENAVTVSNNGEQDFGIGTSERITVKDGDFFGWRNTAVDLISYRGRNGEDDDNYMMALGATNVGDVVDWGSVTPVNDRSYAIRMDTTRNSDPSFTNIPDTVTKPSSTAVGPSLFTVSVTDIDTYDISSLSVVMTTSTTQFSFDTSTKILSLAQTFPIASNTYTLAFRVTDQCDNFDSQTLTISVTNQAPVINSLPATASISEDETAIILLHTIDATDPDGHVVTCSLSTSVPTSYPFTVKQIPSSTSFGVYSKSSPNFVYSTQDEYILSIDCTDTELTDTEDLTVYILQNQAPTFNNLQGSAIMTTSSQIGTNIFTVDVSDPENDDLTYAMTCDPSCDPFAIFDSGAIQVNQDLTDHTIVGYDLYINVSDGRNTVGPSILTVTVADINNPVYITNLPVTKVVMENTVAMTSVYTVSFSDSDTTQAHTFSMTSSPIAGLTYVSIDSTSGVVSVATSPDYDVLTVTTFVFTVTVSDPIVSDTATMTVEITNVNEAPALSQDAYTLSANESSAGFVIGTPAFGVTDPDVGDSYTLTLDCGTETGYIAMTSPSGVVRFQSNYDLDVGSLPTTIACTVTATDLGGLTDTATLTIGVDYINDNTPVFSPASYTFHAGYYAGVGTSIGTVTATDADAGGHGVLTYTLDQTSLSTEYFSIDNSGVVTTKASLSSLGFGSSVTISSTASDIRGLSDTAPITITISQTTTTSATTTTIRYKTFFEDSRNITWFTLCMVILAGSMMLLAYIICTCHGENGCTACCRKCYGKKLRVRKADTWKPRRRDSNSFRVAPATIARYTVRHPPPHADNLPWKIQNGTKI